MPEPGETVVQRLSRQAGEVVRGAVESAGRSIARRLDTQLHPEDLAAFQAAPSAEYGRFLEAFSSALDAPVVRIGGRVVTPGDYLRLAADKSGLSPGAIETASRSLMGMPFDESDEDGIALRDALLGQLRDNLPGRSAEDGWDPGATPEQIAEFDRAGPLESRYRLTPTGEQGYQSERVYNLFTTFQNGEFAPVWSDLGSKALGVLGAPFDFNAGVAGATPHLAASRFNTPSGRLAESLYWWDRGEPDGTAGDSRGGAKYPSLSSTTLEGVTTKLDSTDNALPYWNQQLAERYLYNLDLDPADRSRLQSLRDDLFRTTPRYPAGADSRQMRSLIRDLRDFDVQARGFANAEYPRLVREYAIPVQAFAGGHDFQGRPTVIPGEVEPTFLSPFGEMLANYPRDAVDLQTLATLGLGAAGTAPRMLGGLIEAAGTGTLGGRAMRTAAGAVRRTLRESIDDLVQEVPTNAAMQAANQPGPTRSTAEAISTFFAPMQEGIATDTEGRPIRANDPSYPDRLNAVYEDRKNRLRSILDRGSTLYGRP